MAVVKLNYSNYKKAVKKNLRYIAHRKGENPRETITRTLFNAKGDTDKKEFYRTIDEVSRGTVFYKIMISPDPAREDTLKDLDLKNITRVTIAKLERQLGRQLHFVAAVHDDHTNKRHVHGIVLLGKRVPRQQFRALATTARLAATQEARLQRKARDRVRAHPRYPRIIASIRSIAARDKSTRDKGRGGKAPSVQPGCRNCGFGEFSGITGNRVYCPMCRAHLKKEKKLSLELEAST